MVGFVLLRRRAGLGEGGMFFVSRVPGCSDWVFMAGMRGWLCRRLTLHHTCIINSNIKRLISTK